MAPIIQNRNSLFCVWIPTWCNNYMKNKTLTKNMPNVKWHAIPPVKGPDSQGVKYGNNKKNPSFNKKPLGKSK
jgi:hypothetical protein